jgi:hypothetical protein
VRQDRGDDDAELRRTATPTSSTVNTSTPKVVSRLVPTSAITAPMKKVVVNTIGKALMPASCITAKSGRLRFQPSHARTQLTPSSADIEHAENAGTQRQHPLRTE